MIDVSLVEDVSELRESMVQFFRRSPGFRLASAYDNAETALRFLPKDQPQVVLMDINLSGMSGIECVGRLKALMPGLQIIMLTVFEDNENIFNALRAGATGYLLKRQPPERLLRAIEEVMAGGSPMSTSIARKVIRSFQKHTPHDPPASRLSPRENEVLELLARGRGYQQIAGELGSGIDTIRTHVRRIYAKLHVHSSSEAIFKCRSRDQPLLNL